MTRKGEPEAGRVAELTREVRVSLLIPTHVLPPLSYSVPEHLRGKVAPGAAVIVPLSGYSRLGVVVGVNDGTRASEPVHEVVEDLRISPGLAEVCRRISESAAMPLSNVLCAALPPGLKTSRYAVVDPAPGWPWPPNSRVSRTALRRHLGGEGLKLAEQEGRVRLDAGLPERKRVEWAEVRRGASPDLRRAPRQRELFQRLSGLGGECPASELLSLVGASRSALRELVRRGAVRLERRPEPPPVRVAGGGAGVDPGGYGRDAGRVVDRGGAWLWRVPSAEQHEAVASVVGAAVEGGEQALVLVPEIETAERLADYLGNTLPDGSTIATYHSGLGQGREGVHQAARDGVADVVVGTRAAVLLPMKRLGAICVLDEPNPSHRAQPGYEGLRIHVRDVVLEREEVEGPGVVLLSAFPSLRVYARADRVRELPVRTPRNWPAARVVDLRGSGTMLSEELIDVCRQGLQDGKRVALIANRLGYATILSCNRCGTAQSCPNCNLPLALHESPDFAVCSRCGYQSSADNKCGACGSMRISPTGTGVERLRDEVSRSLGVPVGMLTAGQRELEDALIVAGTAPCVTQEKWSSVVVADADPLLQGSGTGCVERGFRTLYGTAEAAEDLVVVQTRSPDHYALQSALRGDYPAFAATELPRLRALGYPPFGHLAALTLYGDEESVRGAVESRLRPALEPGVNMSEPVSLERAGEKSAWRVLLRSQKRTVVARSGLTAVRLAARYRGKNSLEAQIEIDPEEV